jgi:hypothetical protein
MSAYSPCRVRNGTRSPLEKRISAPCADGTISAVNPLEKVIVLAPLAPSVVARGVIPA